MSILSILSKMSIFQNLMNDSVEILTLKLIFQIMQQKQILTIFHMLILHVLH